MEKQVVQQASTTTKYESPTILMTQMDPSSSQQFSGRLITSALIIIPAHGLKNLSQLLNATTHSES
jgi:hypothetical protein